MTNMGDDAVLTMDGTTSTATNGNETQIIKLVEVSPDVLGYTLPAKETHAPTSALDKDDHGLPYVAYG